LLLSLPSHLPLLDRLDGWSSAAAALSAAITDSQPRDRAAGVCCTLDEWLECAA